MLICAIAGVKIFASNGYTLTTDATGRLLIVLEPWTDKNGKGQWRAGRDGRKEL